MKAISNHRSDFIESFFSVAVLFVLLIFTFGILVGVPYSGFYSNPINGQIEIVFSDGDSLLRTGDIIEQIGDLSFTQIKSDRRLVLFQETKKGEVIPIKVIREEELITVLWVFPGFTLQEFSNRLFNAWVLGYAFWLAGFTAQLSIRPRDVRRRLFIAANYLVAIFLVSGSLSSFRLWESSTFLHTSTWLMMPIFLQLHWEFPRPLGKTSKPVWAAFYTVASLLAFAEIAHILPKSLYTIGFLVALAGSFILLLVRLFIHKEERPFVALLLFSIMIAFSFSMLTALAIAFGSTLHLGWFTIFSMPFMPLAYFYLIYRRQLGGMETRVNRLLSTYIFLILLGVTIFGIVTSILQTNVAHEFWAFIVMGSAFIACLVTIAFLPRFQIFVDQRLFGITLPYQNLPEIYSGRIATCENLPSLLTLLEDEVFPSLLVRQYAFLQVSEKRLNVLLTKNLPNDLFDLDFISQNTGRYLPSLSPQDGWLRLILPLKVGDATLGFWLLGKRDPDDLYPQVEIPILQSLANQTAIALSNILTNEKLLKLYQSDIQRVELERQNLAHELHDSVLNQLALLHNSLNENTLPLGFLSAYEELKRRLREIVSNLRPPMLTYGLTLAITELAENLIERSAGSLKVTVNLQTTEERLPESIEAHLYRIVQEACENVLRHAQASQITISGSLSPTQAELCIEDNGKGLKAETQFELNQLLAQNHFGLAGMQERAHLIGASIEFKSQPQVGTQVKVLWTCKD
ncbi:MAG: hypothetical protein RIR73_1669 [Chloroflexota bacterium]